jgi:hypothetical protein
MVSIASFLLVVVTAASDVGSRFGGLLVRVVRGISLRIAIILWSIQFLRIALNMMTNK